MSIMEYIDNFKKEVIYDVSNKDLWDEKIIIDSKYWVCNVPNSSDYRTIGSELTSEECDTYNVRDKKGDYEVVAFGYKVFRNKETGEEVSCPWQINQ